jgi:hypothetical protein
MSALCSALSERQTCAHSRASGRPVGSASTQASCAWTRDRSSGAAVSPSIARARRHAYGMLTTPTLADAVPLRMVGAIGTYVFGVALAVAAALSLL